ncbi:MAG: hypothetical protein P8X76_06550 [Maritimibacter sp.]
MFRWAQGATKVRSVEKRVLFSAILAGALISIPQTVSAVPIQTTINGQVVHFNTDDLNSILLLIQQGINPNAIVSTVAQIDLPKRLAIPMSRLLKQRRGLVVVFRIRPQMPPPGPASVCSNLLSTRSSIRMLRQLCRICRCWPARPDPVAYQNLKMACHLRQAIFHCAGADGISRIPGCRAGSAQRR